MKSEEPALQNTIIAIIAYITDTLTHPGALNNNANSLSFCVHSIIKTTIISRPTNQKSRNLIPSGTESKVLLKPDTIKFTPSANVEELNITQPIVTKKKVTSICTQSVIDGNFVSLLMVFFVRPFKNSI